MFSWGNKKIIKTFFGSKEGFTWSFDVWKFDRVKNTGNWLVASKLTVECTTLSMLGKNFSRRHFEIYIYISYFSPKIWGFDISCKLSPQETICIKCQSLFSGKNKKNIPKSQFVVCWICPPKVVKVNTLTQQVFIYLSNSWVIRPWYLRHSNMLNSYEQYYCLIPHIVFDGINCISDIRKSA